MLKDGSRNIVWKKNKAIKRINEKIITQHIKRDTPAPRGAYTRFSEADGEKIEIYVGEFIF